MKKSLLTLLFFFTMMSNYFQASEEAVEHNALVKMKEDHEEASDALKADFARQMGEQKMRHEDERQSLLANQAKKNEMLGQLTDQEVQTDAKAQRSLMLVHQKESEDMIARYNQKLGDLHERQSAEQESLKKKLEEEQQAQRAKEAAQADLVGSDEALNNSVVDPVREEHLINQDLEKKKNEKEDNFSIVRWLQGLKERFMATSVGVWIQARISKFKKEDQPVSNSTQGSE